MTEEIKTLFSVDLFHVFSYSVLKHMEMYFWLPFLRCACEYLVLSE